jgi:protein PhnA
VRQFSHCPNCQSENVYFDGNLWICPGCFHEWSASANDEAGAEVSEQSQVVRDANGNTLQDGDTVTIVKDLKVKGAPTALKAGTKVKNIRLVDAVDGHNISCKIDGFGAMNLKSEVVKKA